MIVGIVGSRDFTNYRALEKFILSHLSLSQITGVVSGGARGADTLAEQFADRHNLPVKVYPADWKKFGKAAGIIRNDDIVKDSDVLFAFPLKGSVGTFDSIRKAYKKKIKVYVYTDYQG